MVGVLGLASTNKRRSGIIWRRNSSIGTYHTPSDPANAPTRDRAPRSLPHRDTGSRRRRGHPWDRRRPSPGAANPIAPRAMPTISPAPSPIPRTTPQTPTSVPAGPRCERWRGTTPTRGPRRQGSAPIGRERHAVPPPWLWFRWVGFATRHVRPEPSRAATPRSGVRVLESEHVAARREQCSRVTSCQQIHQGSFLERVDGPAHHRRDSIALEIMHQQIGGGGQIRDGPRPNGRDTLMQPLADCLAAHAELTAPPRLGSDPTPRSCARRTGSHAGDQGIRQRRQAMRFHARARRISARLLLPGQAPGLS